LKLAMLAVVALHRSALARVVALPLQLRGHRMPVGEGFVALRVGVWVDQHTAGVPSPNGSRLYRRVHPQSQPQLAGFNPWGAAEKRSISAADSPLIIEALQLSMNATEALMSCKTVEQSAQGTECITPSPATHHTAGPVSAHSLLGLD
jgi:hypothetical protein